MFVVVNFIKMFKPFHSISNMDHVVLSILVQMLLCFVCTTIHGILAGGNQPNFWTVNLLRFVFSVITEIVSDNSLVKQLHLIVMVVSLTTPDSHLLLAAKVAKSLKNWISLVRGKKNPIGHSQNIFTIMLQSREISMILPSRIMSLLLADKLVKPTENFWVIELQNLWMVSSNGALLAV